jgi:hypothetical protein
MYPSSFKTLINLDALESAFVSAMLKVTGSQTDEVVKAIVNKFKTLLPLLHWYSRIETEWVTALKGAATATSLDADELFFSGWHVPENKKVADLTMLCELVGVDNENPSASIEALEKKLRSKLAAPTTTQTACFASAIVERCQLLLEATAADSSGVAASGSASTIEKRASRRSSSASPVLEALQGGAAWDDSLLASTPEEEDTAVPPHVAILDDMYHFIIVGVFTHGGASPTVVEFRNAIKQRRSRADRRLLGLQWINTLLDGKGSNGYGCTELNQVFVEAATSILRGSAVDEGLSCSGQAVPLNSAFTAALASIVRAVERNPGPCVFGLSLCLIPFTHVQAACISGSKIVELLGKLCARGNDASAMARSALTAFRVLALRCADWEDGSRSSSTRSATDVALETLSRQIATFLSRHLMDAVEQSSTVAADDPRDLSATGMYDLLSLLDNLAGSVLGQKVISNPRCILGLLQLGFQGKKANVNATATPTTMHTVIRLLAVALPHLKNDKPLQDVLAKMLPEGSLPDDVEDEFRTQAYVIKLLQLKLIHFALPPDPSFAVTTLRHTQGVPYTPDKHGASKGSTDQQVDVLSLSASAALDPSESSRRAPIVSPAPSSGTAVVRMHRRDDQSPSEVLQQYVYAVRRSMPNGPPAGAIGASEELSRGTSAVVHRGSIRSCLQHAKELANVGLVVSVDTDGASEDAPASSSSQSRAAADEHCHSLNQALADRKDARRHYLSADVAGAIANGLIGLIQSLIARAEDDSPWLHGAEAVFGVSIGSLPGLASTLACEDGAPPSTTDLNAASEALVSLCVLGAFREDIHIGGHVLVGGSDMKPTLGEVTAYDIDQGRASVLFPSVGGSLRVPTTSLRSVYQAPHRRVVSILQDEFVCALEALLTTGKDEPVGVQAIISTPIAKDNAARIEFSHRLLADLRTRACMVLNLRLKDKETAATFMDGSVDACRIVTRLAMEATNLGDSAEPRVVAKHAGLRQLLFERQRPYISLLGDDDDADAPGSTELKWHPSRRFPTCRAMIFGNSRTSACFAKVSGGRAGPSNEIPDLPGQAVFTTSPIPDIANGFYWEYTVKKLPAGLFFDHHLHSHALEKLDKNNGWGCDGSEQGGPDEEGCGHGMGETEGLERYKCSEGCDFDLCEDCISAAAAMPAFAVGCSEVPSQPPGPYETFCWPDAAVMIDSQRVIRQGPAVADPADDRPDAQPSKVGDVIGCLWAPATTTLKFTYNGASIGEPMTGLSRGMHAALHLRVPGCEIAANFGAEDYAFPPSSLGDGEAMDRSGSAPTREDSSSAGNVPLRFQESRSTRAAAGSLVKHLSSKKYELPCGECMVGGGHVVVGEGEEVDVDEDDLTERLVEAWTREVFPKIRQRFRNGNDRQEGENQIKGALRGNGMYEMAVFTVDMLYEDSGGRPSDLRLPTIDDIKASANKLGANELSPGMRVLINDAASRTGFEVSTMEQTRGLVGEVVSVDASKGLALVEVYLDGDALLTQWWYPSTVLERANKAAGRAFENGGSVHDLLLRSESELTRLFCRSAVLTLRLQHTLLDSSWLSQTEVLRLLGSELKRIQLPGKCLIQSARADEFFAFTSSDRSRWTNLLEETLKGAIAAGEGAESATVSDLCSSLDALQEASEVCTVEIQVAKGRKGFDVKFPRESSSVLVSTRAPRSSSKFVQPASAKEPWLRLYASETATGPRAAVLPSTDAGPSTSPYILLQTSRLHLRTTAEADPHAEIVLHDVQKDVPLALAFIQGPLLRTAGVPETAVAEVGRILASSLTQFEQSPYMKEVLCQTLAAVIRAMDPLSDAVQPLLACASSVATELHNATIWTTNSASLPPTRLSTFLQSVLELTLAGHEVKSMRPATAATAVKEDPVSREGSASVESDSPAAGPTAVTPPTPRKKDIKSPRASSDRPASPKSPASPAGESGHGRKRTKSKSKRSAVSASTVLQLDLKVAARVAAAAATAAAAAAKVPKWLESFQELDAFLRVLVGWWTGSTTAGDAAVHGIVRNAFASLSTAPSTAAKFIGIKRASRSMSADAFSKRVQKLVESYTVPFPGAMFCGKGDSEFGGKFNGEFILELRTEGVYDACRAALRTATDLRQDRGTDLLIYRCSYASSPESSSSSTSNTCSTFDAMLKRRLLDERGGLAAGVKAALLEIMGGRIVSAKTSNSTEPLEMFLHNLANQKTPALMLVTNLATGPDAELLFKDVCEHAEQVCSLDQPSRLARALELQGFDVALDRYRFGNLEDTLEALSDSSSEPAALPSAKGLGQLVQCMNKQIRRSNISWKRFNPADFSISAAEKQLEHSSELRELPLATLRSRAAIVLHVSKAVAAVLPAIDFRGQPLRRSLADLLTTARGYFLHDMKAEWLRTTLNETAQRFDLNSTPEITLNPLETVGTDLNGPVSTASTQFMQSLLQMDVVDPIGLRVRLASGGDPIFPVVVRFTGEQVAGTSGSFRDFLGRMGAELRERKVPVFMECPSSSMNSKSNGKNILRPGTLPYPVARMLEFVGQLIGIALRADVPFPLDLLPSFWKVLVNPPGAPSPLTLQDIRDADWATGGLLARVRAADTESSFAELLAEAEKGETPELQLRLLRLPPLPIRLPGADATTSSGGGTSSGGSAPASPTIPDEDRPSSVEAGLAGVAGKSWEPITWTNRKQFIAELEALRYSELTAEPKMAALRRGLQTTVPVDLLAVMTWEDIEYRVCGEPDISLSFLKANTNYTGGLSEADPHIQFFWSTLESFTAEELQAFVKFACNQERIPASCTVQSCTCLRIWLLEDANRSHTYLLACINGTHALQE